MQTCAANGLATADGDVRRWTLECVLGAQQQFEGKKIETMWRRAKADSAHKVLSRNDVTVTNQSDKDLQLPKIRLLDEQVRSAFADMRGKGAERRELAARKRQEAQELIEEAARLEEEARELDAQVERAVLAV